MFFPRLIMFCGYLYKTENFTFRFLEESIFIRFVPDNFLFPPLFIIGAPRVGSTILFQLLVNCFDFGYMTNFHCLLYGSPALAHLLLRFFRIRIPPSPYESYHGRVKGILSPSECGADWYKYFPVYPPYTEYVEDKKLYKLRKSLIFFERAWGKPLLFKNMYNTFRLKHIVKAIPEAKFIVIRRKVLPNAISLLETRIRVFGTKNECWSMEVPRIDELKKYEPEKQVLLQIKDIYEIIDRAKKEFGDERFMEVKYEDILKDCTGTLDRIKNFYGVDIREKNNFNPVIKNGNKFLSQLLSGEDLENLKRYAEEIFGGVDVYP